MYEAVKIDIIIGLLHNYAGGVLTYVACSECDCVRVVPSIVDGAS